MIEPMAPVFAVTNTAPIPANEHLAPALDAISETEAYAAVARARSEAVLAELLEAEAELADLTAQQQAEQAAQAKKKPKTRRRK